MILKSLKVLSIAVVGMFAVNSVNGQDLMAHQAPIERKLRVIDSVALRRQIVTEQSVYPAYSLYKESWNNDRVHVYGDMAIPDSFRIDLSGFTMPTTSRKVTSNYGYRRRSRRMHKGIDVKVYTGDTIYAAFDGKIRIVDYERRGYGKYVVIRHDNGLETIYGHLSKHLVTENQYVRSGEPIGLGGNTGRSTGSHLHFETRLLGEVIRPDLLFDFPNQDVTGDTYLYRSPRSLRSSSGRSIASNNASGGGDVRYYKVRKGDNLSKIAKRHGVSVDMLCRLNKITRKTILSVGQLIRCS